MDKDDASTGDQLSAEESASMLLSLGTLVNLFGAGHLDSIVNAGGLGEAELQREVEAIDGALWRPPVSAWLQFEELFEPVSVSGTDPTEYEAVVPLWTERGVSTRGVRVRLVPLGFRTSYVRRVIGFEDVTTWPSEWTALAPDPVLPREPTGPALAAPVVPPENPIPLRWRPALWDVIHRLVLRDYEALQRDGIIANLDTPGDMVKGPIEEYADPLVDLPANGWNWSDHRPPYGGPGIYYVNIPIWTAHQGFSDLSLEGEVHDGGGSDVRIVLNGVYVM